MGASSPERGSTLPMIGHSAKAGTGPKKFIREVRLNEEPADVSLGDVLTVEVFETSGVRYVDVVSTTKGCGFTGVMKTAHICEGYGIMCAMHGGSVASLHAACAIYNTKYFERLVPETYYSPPGIVDASTEIDAEGYVLRLVEKDPNPSTTLAVPAIYGIPARLLGEVGRYLESEDRPDNLGYLAEWLVKRHRVRAVPLAGRWIDVGTPDDYERAWVMFSSGRAPVRSA